MNDFQGIQSSGLLKNDYGAKNATEAALKKRREELFKTKMDQDVEEKE
jgi:hypothetical protein